MSNYVAVTWTAGDTITEAKLDNMVANDRAEDAHEAGLYMINSSGKIKFRNASGVLDAEMYEDGNNVMQYPRGANGFAGIDINLFGRLAGTIATGTNQVIFPPATRDFTIEEVLVQVAPGGTNPDVTDMIFDVNLDGSTIWSTQANRLTLVHDTDQASQTVFNTVDVNKYQLFALDVDQTDTVAQDLLFVIIGR